MQAQKSHGFDVYVGNLHIFQVDYDVLRQSFAATPDSLAVFVEDVARWVQDLVRGG